MKKKTAFEMLLEMEQVQTNPEIVDVLKKEIENLDKRTDRDKAARAAKNPDGDTFKPVVLKAVPNHYVTVDDILANISDPSATRQKVINRLGVLVKEGLVKKQTDKTEDKTVTTYCLA